MSDTIDTVESGISALSITEDVSEEQSTIVYPTTMDELKSLMLSGEQSKGVDYYTHGVEVADKFAALMSMAKLGLAEQRMEDAKFKWRLPKWFVKHQQWIYAQLQPRFEQLRVFHIWHDCGKALVKTVDDDDQAHYKDHDNVSRQAFLMAGGDESVARLIGDDLICNLIRSTRVANDLAENHPDILAQLVTTIAKMHVFHPTVREGGASVAADLTTAEGFKIKLKKIEYYGWIIVRFLLLKASTSPVEGDAVSIAKTSSSE